jgi:hypothetical protein
MEPEREEGGGDSLVEAVEPVVYATSYFRVYYNSSVPGELPWSVDFGTTETELNVKEVYLTAPVAGVHNPSAEWPEPQAWLEGRANVRIEEGVAYID